MMMAVERITDQHDLDSLLRALKITGNHPEVSFRHLVTDSRKIQHGDLFIACENAVPYIEEAIAAGAVAVLLDASVANKLESSFVPLIPVHELEKKIGFIASWYYDHPARTLDLVAVTGTNGKTTVSYLLGHALSRATGQITGLIGTLGHGPINNLSSSTHTTPEALALQGILNDMRVAGIRNVVMEVSSHGIDQSRIAALGFKVAIFTNLSRDHLDYQGTLDTYAETKRKLFTDYPVSNAVINLNDAFGRQLLASMPKGIARIGYRLGPSSEPLPAGTLLVAAELMSSSAQTMELAIDSPWGSATLSSPLIGHHNAENLLAVFSALCVMGLPIDLTIESLATTQGIPGRLQRLTAEEKPVVFIDYAHTPAALEQALKTLKAVCMGHLWCVFGCGGDRDQGKRALMGHIAEDYADRIILTNDNPRSEDPHTIVQQILDGIENKDKALIELDREAAIRQAIEQSEKRDLILIAGKGHEDYQEIKGKRFPFSDEEIVRQSLEQGQ